MTIETTWVLGTNVKTASELSGGAKQLGNVVNAIVFGTQDEAQEVIAFGASKVVVYPVDATVLLEDYAATIAQTLTDEQARLVVVDATTQGRLLAGKLASLLGTSALNASELSFEGDAVQIKHLVYGGAAVCTETTKSGCAVITANAGLFEPATREDGRQGEVVLADAASTAPAASGLRIVEAREKLGEQVNLASAKRVVGVGRGFAAEADLGLARDLAETIGAELACSRPITEGENWMARERYIGVSGVVLKPELYLAVGISGQVQHMVGINQAKTLVAINKDKNAPIFKQVDVGIVGDLYDLLPTLLEALKTA
jgi:electron transfer flavoprotein alpha subunit